jgi:hypothetical protein
MEAYFAFTDECGQYQRIRSEKFNKAHPFYVRSTVIISWPDYLLLQNGIDDIKKAFDLNTKIEVKWSHYGSAMKKNYRDVPHRLLPEQLKEFYSQTLSLLCKLESVCVYYTLTDNNIIGQVNEIALLRMHLQNALQKVQKMMSGREGFAIVVADDLNDKTKVLKQATYKLMLTGDYVQYTNIKKGLYIDFSNQCPGLQVADICAGVFTASLKYENAPAAEKHKFQCGHDLLFSKVYKKIRNNCIYPPCFDVYKSGIKEVPNGAGIDIARELSKQVETSLENDFLQEMFPD